MYYIKFIKRLTSHSASLFLICCIAIIITNACQDSNNSAENNKVSSHSTNAPLIVGISADYPPFEFIENGEFKGLDIDLTNLIGKYLNRKIEFKDLNYSNLFTALNSGQIDMSISTITFTEERSKNFDLSNSYYLADIALIFRKDQPIRNISDLNDKKVGAQLGSTMEMWAKDCGQKINLVSMDVSLQLIEAVKSKQLDLAVSEEVQAKEFCKRNPDLGYLVVAKADHGYVVALKQGSILLKDINSAIEHIKQQQDFEKLKHKWLDILFEMEVHDAS